jgi:phenylacetate-coenzyme A ligase PaaK-like adenylate-forming protein
MTTVATARSADTRRDLVAAADLLARDRWSRDRLVTFQRASLRELLRHAVASSPYYRDLLGDGAEDAALDELPTLTKATLMEQFDRVVADPRLRLAAVEAHAAGADPGALLCGAFHVFGTSGTTGRRGVFPETTAELAAWVRAGWRVRQRLGLGPDLRVVGIGAPTPLHITQKLFAAFGGFGGCRPALTVTTPLPALVEALNRDRPELLITVPTVARMLAEEQLEGGLAIRPRGVLLAGEVLAEDTSRRVAEAWGVEPFQVYAATEALMMASEAPERVGLHVAEDLVVLEVIDERGRPVAPGQPGYKVLVTSLVGRALPLIRYELADTVTIAPGPDPSGRPYLRIERVDGRDDDVLRLPALRGGEAVVLPYRLRAPFAPLPEVRRYQIVLQRERLAVRVVLAPGASAETLERVGAGMRAALAEAGAVPTPVVVEAVAEIEREPGLAKVKLVKTQR